VRHKVHLLLTYTIALVAVVAFSSGCNDEDFRGPTVTCNDSTILFETQKCGLRASAV
jgi:hypothetical protein